MMIEKRRADLRELFGKSQSGAGKRPGWHLARRRFTRAAVCAIVCATFVGAGWAQGEAGARARRPNLIFIYVDDMGYGDLSCYGNKKVKTPNIDRLATEGIRLTQFYVNSPTCSPSRVAVTTGQYPARWRINSYLNNRKRNRARDMADYLDPKAPAVARAFKQAGYATAHFGKWHMGGGRDVDDAPLPTAYGFDESLVSFEGLGDRILPPGGLSKQSAKLGHGKITNVKKHEQTRIYVDRSIDFVRRNREGPFYLHLWLNDVHDAHEPAPGEAEKFASITDNPFEQKFFAVLVEMDRQLGRLFDAIDEMKLAENTIVVLASDNGPTDWPSYYRNGATPPGSAGPFKGRKWCLYEGGIRMPFIARWKGVIPAGRTNTESVVCGVDLFPTFCALAGVAPLVGVEFDGEDMSGALLGRSPKRTRPIFWEYGRDETYLKPGNPKFVSPNLAVRDGDWKLLLNADGSRAELYDLANDPGETTNLASRNPAVVQRLEKPLLDWRRSLP